ncbi:hypothetical protein MIND_00776200 [Mycena indigotica]|uniref:Uncharacterized protein n=1 Tax=Mycena indigotica TaxID=2126181 RepID=A0A8H6W7H2_9AGAR|nr:uncharacterized protein MIND_00776200 [Mycena indigotica]KAF7302094.1 hypothetical protein MIND_00776200 [Mycena indigotica]
MDDCFGQQTLAPTCCVVSVTLVNYHIVLSTHQANLQQRSIWETQLLRSADAPLDVILSMAKPYSSSPAWGENFVKMVEAFVASSPRWRSFHIITNSAWPPFPSFQSIQLPLFEEVTFDGNAGGRLYKLGWDIPLNNSSKLRHVVLGLPRANSFSCDKLPWSQIRTHKATYPAIASEARE